MRKRLKRLAEMETTVSLEDHFGDVHTGKVVRRVSRFKGSDNLYYFQRDDGISIRLIGRGTQRAVATPEGGLALRVRNPYTSSFNRWREQYKFENMAGDKSQY